MTTDRLPRPTGRVSARTIGAARILRRRAVTARRLARSQADQDGPFAASLRGKAKGYEEAADLVERLERGGRLNSAADRARRRVERTERT